MTWKEDRPRLIYTAHVDSHRINGRYGCLLIDLLHDPTFHYVGHLVKADLMPTDEWTLDLALELAKKSPTFKAKLIRLAEEISFIGGETE